MSTKLSKMAKAKQPRRILVWGSAAKGKGIGIERYGHRRKNGSFSWNILHLKDGKVVLVHRSYSSMAEAIREAKNYARYEEKHPRKGFIR